MTSYEQWSDSLGRVFDAIPKGKRAPMMRDMTTVEHVTNAMAQTLHNLRRYFLNTTGPDSPFVGVIDELVPRWKDAGDKPAE